MEKTAFNQRELTCANCAYLELVGTDNICRARPPTAFVLALPGPQGPMRVQGGAFPNVNPISDWCGEHVRKQ